MARGPGSYTMSRSLITALAHVCLHGACAHVARNTARTTGYGTSTCVCMDASAHVMRNTVRTTGYRVSCVLPTQQINHVTTTFSTMSPQRFRNDFTTIPQRPRIATAGKEKTNKNCAWKRLSAQNAHGKKRYLEAIACQNCQWQTFATHSPLIRHSFATVNCPVA